MLEPNHFMRSFAKGQGNFPFAAARDALLQ